MAQAIVIERTGGPEVLRFREVAVPAPADGEIRMRHAAIGANFLDTYHRNGLYPHPLPFTPGTEAVGFVTSVGANVDGLKEGDRVCYAIGPVGSYSTERVLPATSVVKVPVQLKDEQVAGVLVRGLTAWYLIRQLHHLRAGETVLFHAAAGGVGLIFCQWARHLGATVIGTVGTEAKAHLARAAGCHHTVLYRNGDWVQDVRRLAGNQGVAVAYDGVGRETYVGSLDCLQPRGLLVSFGSASGAVPPLDLALLSARGSLFVTRPRLGDYVATSAAMQRGCDELFHRVIQGVITVTVGLKFALAEAGEAHRALESRATTGATVLIP